ncbi:MAG: TonB-dependent receptor [Daejeonella sp.]|uniref:TonB-dependent receptor n=1 Tax=Daejeonella sp. TaxID=2805397 RepID=UPI002736FE5D|nr:TonB-dependent receptor [Daejeonella sp.]MDP3467418.1 TonB-dependent receptor [Daejeonella sp.]
MKHNIIVKILSISLLLILGTLAGFSQQTGRISGRVTDSKSGETLIGLTVKITGATFGASTDIEGRYSLGNLNPGKYSLGFSYIGYQAKNITDIEVLAGKTTTLDVIMEEASSLALEEVVITATVRQESISALYAQQKNSISISSGITSELIRRTPDRSTSEVLKRVSGASIQENKFVIIRGLADRYNSSILNNAVLPSSEPDRKAFSFDIIPANLIDRIVVNKTASADLPGDFAGGVIQVITRDVPEENFLNASVSFGYNNQSTFKDFTSNARNKYDFLGFDDGSRKLPAGFPGSFQAYNPLSNADKAKYSAQVKNSYPEVSQMAIPTQNHQLTWGRRKELKNGASFGNVVSLSYRNSQSIAFAERKDYEFSGTPFYEYSEDISKYSSNLGALANFAYIKGGNKIAFKNMYNRTFEDNYTARIGFTTDNIQDVRLNNSDLTTKSLLNSQLEGDHQLGKKQVKLTWNLNYARVERDQPDQRSVDYRRSLGSQEPFRLIDRNTRRLFSDLEEDTYGVQAAVSIPVKFFEQQSTFKIGALKQFKQRIFNARIFNYIFVGPSVFERSYTSLPKDEIFAPVNINENGFVLSEFTNNTDSYDANSDLNAGFLLMDNKFGERFRISYGARLEQFAQTLNAIDFSGQAIAAKQSNFDVLPSANLTYTLNAKSNIRLSGSQTVSRPEFRELALFNYYDFISQTSVTGNPNLKRAKIFNGDIRYELYPSAGETFTVSAFYKNFDDPIEQRVNSNSTPVVRGINYLNADQATSLGIELDVRKKLSFLGDKVWLDNLTIFANASYIDSKVQGVGIDRPLQGQSPYLINGGLQYFSPKTELTFTSVYNRIGQRIFLVGYQGYPDIYENARDVLDFQVSKRVLKSQAEIKLNVGDILNQSTVFYQNNTGDSKMAYDGAGIDRLINSYKLGSNVSLSFSYNLGLGKNKK